MTFIARPLLILIFAVVAILCCGGCDTPTIYIVGADRDIDIDVDIDTDVEIDLDSDVPVDADPEFVDADIDLDDITDGDINPDGPDGPDTVDIPDGVDHEGILAGPLTVVLTNTGPDAAYVTYTGSNSLGLDNGGLTLLDRDGNSIPTHPGCTAPCGDECVEIACDQPIPQVRQILPGESMTLEWEGEYYSFESCETDSGGTATCHRQQQAPHGRYSLRFCYSLELRVSDWGMPRRQRDDIIQYASMDDRICINLSLELVRNINYRDYSFAANLDGETKEPGYCGQMWSYSIEQPNMSLQGEPYSIDQGSSPVFLMRPQFDEAPLCYRFGEVMSTVREDDHQVYVHAAVWNGLRECGGAYEAALHALVLPPLPPGDWTALFGSYATPETLRHDFTVNPCPSCVECPDGEFGSYGDLCSADCGCIDQGAVCGNNISCMNYCLSADDCPPEHGCGHSPYTAAAVHACSPLADNQCQRDDQCLPGHICTADGNGYTRCVRDMDTRIAAGNQGRGIACGCDAECPGMQSCLRFEQFVPDGFCAFICRDNRDCPDNWQCIGMTQSGLASICMPPWEE